MLQKRAEEGDEQDDAEDDDDMKLNDSARGAGWL